MPTETAPAATPAGQEPQWRPQFNPWLIALTVTLASFMEVLDTSIANVALPHIAGGLSASEDEATWVLTSYLVSNAIILPLSGWLSLLLGRKRFYMSCVLMFTLSSFLCGIAPTLGLLVLFRVLQGIGGGGLQPSEQAILADTFLPRQRGMAFAIYGVAVVTAPAIGPTLGGWITDSFTWRWIFFINIPVGILSLILTSFMLEDPPYFVGERRQRLKTRLRVDYWGIIFVALGLGFLQIVLDKGERDDWFASNFIRACALIAAAGLILAVYWEFKQKDPVVDLSLLKDRNFGISAFLMFMVRGAAGQHGSDPAISAIGYGLFSNTGGHGNFARRVAGDGAAAVRGPSAREGRGALDDRRGTGDYFFGADLHDGFQHLYGFQTRRHRALFPGRRLGLPIRADQHRGVRLRSADQEQCRLGIDQPGAQRGRKSRHFHRDDDTRPSRTVSSGTIGRTRDAAQSGF
jgi:MFS family permease